MSTELNEPSESGRDSLGNSTTNVITALCCKDASTAATTSLNSFHANELEVDLSHFSTAKEILGTGGFGIVRRIVKLTGQDASRAYAMKTLSKATILSRPSGTAAVMTELKALIFVQDCPYICKLHYAFQDETFLYMVLDYAVGGDLRFNLRKSPNLHFSENLSRMFIYQVFLALNHCHKNNILHRGKQNISLLKRRNNDLI